QLGAGDEQTDLGTLVRASDLDVAQRVLVAQAHLAPVIDGVVPHAEVRGRCAELRPGFDPRAPSRKRGATAKGAVRTVLVVLDAETVQLRLQLRDRARRALMAEIALEGLVEALDLAAGLGVIGRRVHDANTKA